MSQNKRTFKDDIKAAEKNILIISWLGIASALGLIVHTLVNLH